MQPQTQVRIALEQKLYPYPKGHPLYTETVGEQVAGITAVTLDDVKALHASLFGAANSDLVVAGDFDSTAVRTAAMRAFGDWRSPAPFARLVRTYAPSDSTRIKIETPDKANAMYVSAEQVQIRDDDPDYPALMLANFMLGGGFLNSRLATRIRQKEGISYGVGSSFNASSFDRSGQLFMSAIYAPQNVERLERAFRDELDRVEKQGFVASEIASAKSGYLDRRSQRRANDDELVDALTDLAFAGRTMAFDAAFEKSVRALTPEQINAAVRKYFDPSKLITVEAGDFAKNPPVKVTP